MLYYFLFVLMYNLLTLILNVISIDVYSRQLPGPSLGGFFLSASKLLSALLYRLGCVNIYDAIGCYSKTQLKVDTGSTGWGNRVIKPLFCIVLLSNLYCLLIKTGIHTYIMLFK